MADTHAHSDRRRGPEERSRSAGIETPDLPSFVDRLEAALADAPIDDEPLTDEDRAAIEAGWEDYRQGRTITLEELLQRRDREDETASAGTG